ncbi:LysM peptidoglycan-binding domain-containing M23 family metallopeptidase [Halomonas lysinitropha]|uniref:Murein hydrolase activator NlpD n=1 Tax=Halomonas lysinitropha TaxID=2607506 RepID=A0A5K1IBR6_9GAMM|nr:LysM peptidoglycan-binding domain-containing M23 family metallopeptidase [Halomonas lysinitropha]VVZ97242.1 Murein hydrolase activator NlpD precursor [Halomonas lysinitropha]
MAQCPVAGQGSPARLIALTLLLVSLALLLVGCAGGAGDSRPDRQNAGQWITIQRGDTLGEIANRADVPLVRLERFNPGIDARHLAIGQRVLVPGRDERAPSGGPYRYRVRPGDTYSAIAQRFGSRAERIQAANPGIAPTNLKVGQLIQVPLGGRQATSTGTSGGSTAGKASSTRQASRPASKRLPDPGNLPASAHGWPWPLDDYRVERPFGADSRGTLQPMLLSTRRGSRAQAVADGEVRFADSMRQLGQVVIVHHADNLQSVYALCAKPLVASGDSVKRGAPVCEIGQQDGSPRLLFDMRHGGKPIDPARVLR